MTENILVPCILCGEMFHSFVDRKKHDLASHYDYVLLQCGDDHETLRDWAKTE